MARLIIHQTPNLSYLPVVLVVRNNILSDARKASFKIQTIVRASRLIYRIVLFAENFYEFPALREEKSESKFVCRRTVRACTKRVCEM